MINHARIEATLEKAATGLALIGGAGLVFATAITCVSILLRLMRRLADGFLSGFVDPALWSSIRPILGEEELVQYGVGFALFAVLPLVALKRGHIRVDLFKPLFGGAVNTVLDLAGDLAMALIAFLLMTRQWGLIFSRPRRGEETILQLGVSGDFAAIGARLRDVQESQILGLPLWQLYSLAQICMIAFFITALFCVWRSAAGLWPPPRPDAAL